MVQRLAGRLRNARWNADMLQQDGGVLGPETFHASCRICAEGLTSAFRCPRG